jgi:hypothetical protein
VKARIMLLTVVVGSVLFALLLADVPWPKG